MKRRNPVIFSDFPDPDVIRVGGTYYMASTTMYYMPGGDLLRSGDLIHWEFASHIYDTLGDSPADRLENGENIFGQGMWAPSLRFHDGKFYVVFSCNNTHSTLLFTADDPEGEWTRHTMYGFFYDPSLFFDDDGRTYIVHGNTVLRLTELEDALRLKAGGLDRVIVRDKEGQPLGYEGSHLYKHDGRYYLFTCHMPAGEKVIKTEDCFIADSLDGEFRGREIIREDMGHRGLGIAQGGMVDTPDGKWYLFMFQDRGALGRSPLILPMEFDSEGYPVPARENGVIPRSVECDDAQCYKAAPLISEAFLDADNGRLHPCWQFSHDPDAENHSFPEAGRFVIRTGRLSDNLLTARNTLTQRCFGEKSMFSVLLDGSGMNIGDRAGLCIYISAYAAAALIREKDGFSLALLNSPADDETIFGMKDFTAREPKTLLTVPAADRIYLRAEADFSPVPDTVRFYYSLTGGEWFPLGGTLPIYFKMDMFTGSRFGLFMYSTEKAGGSAGFSDIKYTVHEP